MRIFPRFVYKGKGDGVSDPSRFYRPPAITVFYPNYLSLNFAPFPGIDIQAEYWVPASNTLAGRFTIFNHSALTESFRLELAGILNPIGAGIGLSPDFINGRNILTGSLEGMTPVVLMSGAPLSSNSPFMALTQDVELFPGNYRHITWVAASLADTESSFLMAENILSRAWDAEISRLENLNCSQMLEIQTGNPHWDEVLSLSQKTAYGLIFRDEVNSSIPPFVLSRLPDQGFSLRGDGSDFPTAWNGPTAMDALYLSSLILPGGALYCQRVLESFLSAPQQDGFINWKALSTNNYQQILSQPLLATLALKIFYCTGNKEWLTSIYPILARFFFRWFSEEQDHDSDDFPEWDHPHQSGLSESPLYDLWHTNSQFVSIKSIESPALVSMLYRECDSLLKIGEICEINENTSDLNKKLESLALNIGACWNNGQNRFLYRDFANHSSTEGKKIGIFKKGKHKLDIRFSEPTRLVLQLSFSEQETRPLTITISGSNKKGNFTERIVFGDLIWAMNKATFTTRNDFLKIYQVVINGLSQEDQVVIDAIDYTQFDISLLLPLWSGAPLPDDSVSKLANAIKSKYLKPFGLPVTPVTAPYVPLYWNQLIGEGLIRRGHKNTAVRLMEHIMDGLSKNLQQQGALFERYHGNSAVPQGERFTLSSLAPLGLFLQTIGIMQLSPSEIVLDGYNPYPWPVTVRYRNLSLSIHAKDATITFPDGQVVNVSGKGPHKIYFE
ncbi:MAG: hypothetical protein LWX83_04845 [Anaerolineae bacterium]|nr:hypothetical protein [Anaerolineae bacterium]